MKTQHLATCAVAAVIGLNVLSGLACSQSYCPYGVYPFSGATGVSADTTVTFYASAELPHDLPALEAAFSFVNNNNEASVPFTVEVDPTASTFTLTPLEPLQPGATYRVSGVQIGAYQGGGTWWTSSEDQTNTVFSVESGDATALEAAYDAEFEEVIVGFSEPIDVDAWVVEVSLPTKPDDTGASAAMALLEPVGSWSGDDHLQRYTLTEGDAAVLFAEERTISVRPAGDDTAEPIELWTDPHRLPEDVLAPLLSIPHCEGW